LPSEPGSKRGFARLASLSLGAFKNTHKITTQSYMHKAFLLLKSRDMDSNPTQQSQPAQKLDVP